MARRKKNDSFDDLVELVSMLPWWVGVLLAPALFFVGRVWAAQQHTAVMTHPNATSGIFYALALLLQFAAPLVLGMLAKQQQQRKLNANNLAGLLNEEQQAAAAALGAALRLGAHLSGRSEALLASFEVAAVDGKLVLRVKKKVAHLVTETAERRHGVLAEAEVQRNRALHARAASDR